MRTLMTIFLLIFINICYSQYKVTPDNKYIETGGSEDWGKVLKMKFNLESDGTTAKFYIFKIDGGQFSSSGKMRLKSGGYSTKNFNITNKTVSKGAYFVEFDLPLSNVSSFPLKIYARYDADIGGSAWVGPISIDKEDVIVNDVTPKEAILGQNVTFTIKGENLNNELVYWIQDFNGTDGVNSSNSSTVKTFTGRFKDNTGKLEGKIKLKKGDSKSLKDFFVNVYFPIPEDLNATATSSSDVSLSWSKVNGTHEYRVYRSTNSNFSNKTLVDKITSNYIIDDGRNSNTTYYYKVQACQNTNDRSCSDLSPLVSVRTKNDNTNINNAPNQPRLLPLPDDSKYYVGEKSKIPVQCKGDPDNDVVKIHVWADNSNYSETNPKIIDCDKNTAEIIFNKSGSNKVYAKAVDDKGESSEIYSENYTVYENSVTQKPGIPTFISLEGEFYTNTNYHLRIKSGTSDNGNNTKLKLWSNKRIFNGNSAYITSYKAGGSEFRINVIFGSIGDVEISCCTVDANGVNGNTVTKQINVVVEEEKPIDKVNVGLLKLTATTIVEQSNKVFKLSGNAAINDIIRFEGDVIVDKSNLSISGNGRVYLSGIKGVDGDVTLYTGEFRYVVNSSKIKSSLINEANEEFKLAQLPVHIDDITLLKDGINISGEIEFPELFGLVRSGIRELQITKSKGVELAGEISLKEIPCKGFKLKNVFFDFNTIKNEFEGNAEIETKLFEAGANIKIIDTGIDKIGLYITMTNPKPLGTTGLALKGMTGSIENIQSHPNPPMKIMIGTDLVPVGVPSEIIELNDVSLTYEFGTSLIGSGSFTVLGTETANAGFEVREGLFKIKAEVNFYNVVNAAIEAGIAKNNNNGIDVFARFNASIQLPGGDDFPFDWLNSLGYDLPYKFADFDNILYNNTLSGKGYLNLVVWKPEFSYLLTYKNGGLKKEFAKNFSLFNDAVFQDKKNAPLKFMKPRRMAYGKVDNHYSRFEGRSLILEVPNSSLKGLNNKNIQDFVLSKKIESLIVRVKPEILGNTPVYSLVSPSGVEINSDNVSQVENVIFTKDENKNETFYTINNADPGIWKIEVINQQENYLVDIFGTDDEPAIIIGSVQQTNKDVTVTWVDDNPDAEGSISLYYDFDNKGLDGKLIKSGISENSNIDSYTFNTSGMKPGKYYVYAVMYDKNGSPVTSYGVHPFTISSEVESPTNLQAQLRNDGDIYLSWECNDPNSRKEYVLYYESGNNVSILSDNIDVGSSLNYSFKPENNKGDYSFMVVALDDNNNSLPSEIVKVNVNVDKTIELNAGWNLVGFNIIPENIDIKAVFSSVLENVNQVKTEFKSYAPDNRDILNTLKSIEVGKGYWVNMAQQTTLNVSGSSVDISKVEIHLEKGWNLISYPGNITLNVNDAFNSISEDIILVKSVDKSYNPSLQDILNTLKNINPGDAFWVNVRKDCVLKF